PPTSQVAPHAAAMRFPNNSQDSVAPFAQRAQEDAVAQAVLMHLTIGMPTPLFATAGFRWIRIE
ncbi:MAG: hypothetical protein OEW08_09040, partial [Gammaproteobacteria bacterium]|nr:hypothetical protein [Gammaproteobacteria bacterium]